TSFHVLEFTVNILFLTVAVFRDTYSWMIQIWTIAQFFMIYAKHKGNPKYADIIYDVTQGLRFKVDISFLFAERAYFFGINIFAILLYVIFFKLLIPAKSNIPN
ncbi:hypothetical protein, partial [Ulvibacterium marinum]|uniref:hypothetical protein n=1 Tax=Ulvibacterium marinum TaxID=2419782 RepID=UPI002494F2A3